MKILLVKLGAIGDVVQSAVAVNEYRRRYPDIDLDWAVGYRLKPLVDAFGVADRVIAIQDDGFFSQSKMEQIGALVNAMFMLAREGRYDRVVIAYSDARYGLLTSAVRASEKVQFRPAPGRPSPIHHRSRVHEYWRLLSGGDGEAIDIAAATQALGNTLGNLPVGEIAATLPARYVAFAAGGAKNLHREDALRRWPIDRYRALAQRLLNLGLSIVLLGGENDRWVLDAFENVPVTSLIGKTGLLDLIPVLGGANAIVANDSGILHLAALTRTGIVGLFGPTPANACIPRGRARTIVLEAGNRVSCSPCYDGKNYAPCSRNLCLEAITVDQVFAAVTSLLEEPREPAK